MSFVQTLTSREIDSRLARIREERLDPHGFSERLAQAAMAGIGLDILEQGRPAAIAVPEACVYCHQPIGDDGPTCEVAPDAFGSERGVAHGICRASRVAAGIPEPRPANPWAIKGRMEKVARLMSRLDRFAGHQVTAAEVEGASPGMIAAMLAGETRKPSDATVAALADALLAREVGR